MRFRKKFVIGQIAFICLLLLRNVALACSCDLDMKLLSKPEAEQIRIAQKRAKAVFSGQVIDITVDEKSKSYWARIKVQRSWKNTTFDEVIIRGTTICCICEYVFLPGENYLIYASDYDHATKEYGTSICTRTVTLAQAATDLRVLGKAKTHSGDKR